MSVLKFINTRNQFSPFFDLHPKVHISAELKSRAYCAFVQALLLISIAYLDEVVCWEVQGIEILPFYLNLIVLVDVSQRRRQLVF